MSDLSRARSDPGQGGRKLSGFTLGHLAEGDLGLYERLGFHPVERVGDGWTMLLELSPSGIDVRVN